MSIDTLLYHSGMPNAPSATLAAAGALTTLLDACLVNGFNSRSISGITRSGNVATAAVDGGNPYGVGDVVLIEGASVAAYNGRQRVTAANAGTISFLVEGSPATPTGTITARHPGAGWQRLAIATNVVGYRTIAGGVEHWVQIEDDNPFADSGASVRLRMAVGLTGLNTGVQLAEQVRIQKANGGWVLVADGRTVYLFMGQANSMVFGEAASFADADDYCFLCSRGETANAIVSIDGNSQTVGRIFPGVGPDSSFAASALAARLLRSYSQVGSDVSCYPAFMRAFSDATTNAQAITSSRLGSTLANPVDGKVPLFPVYLVERASGLGPAASMYRGTLRGVYSLGGYVAPEAFSNGLHLLTDVVVDGVTRRAVIVRWGGGQVLQMALDLGNWG